MLSKKLFTSFVITYYLEIIFHILVFKSFTFKGIIILTLFTFTSALFIDLISSLFGKKFNKWFFISITILITIIFIAQYIDYKFYGNIISIYSIFHGTQVFGFLGAIISVIKQNILGCLLLFLPIPCTLIFNKKIRSSQFNYKKILYKTILLITCFVTSILMLNIDAKDIYSSKNLYFNKHVPNQTAQTFGILTTMRLDLERFVSNFEEESLTIPNATHKVVKEKEYNKTNIDFVLLANEETNKEIKNIHNYMASLEPTEKNEYTGMFKGKNLIAFVAEAFSPIAVNKELTPTLYKLVNTGFTFNNFYTPVYYVSTSDGEYVSLTSLLPKESVWSFFKSSDNYLPYVYGNVFKDLGYVTKAYHNGNYKYYDRHKSHPNMGYDYKACGNGLKINCKKWPQSDLEMIEATFDEYGNEEHFMTYYMTVSGHLEYNFMGNNMAYKNRSIVKETSYSEAIKAYIATQIELDKALELLINKLETAGKLDDTVIVLSADHYPYGLTNNQIGEVMDIQNEKFDIHKNNLIIWNNKMEKQVVVNKYAESLDIVPTVLNLFGVHFDSRLLIGQDILSNSDGLVIFNDRSWITEYGKYNAATKEFINFKDLPDEDYINTINGIVYNKFVISKKILENNYYKYVAKEIK